MILDFRFQPHKANAYSVIYDCRLRDSAALAAVNTVRRTPVALWTLRTL